MIELGVEFLQEAQHSKFEHIAVSELSIVALPFTEILDARIVRASRLIFVCPRIGKDIKSVQLRSMLLCCVSSGARSAFFGEQFHARASKLAI